MTTINEFLPFADQSNANLIPYAEWVSAAKRLTGFVSGIAKSNEMNRVWAQGAQAGYAIAKFIERTLNEDVYVADGERLADQFYRSIVQMSYRATPIGCVLTFPVHVEIDGYVATNNGGSFSYLYTSNAGWTGGFQNLNGGTDIGWTTSGSVAPIYNLTLGYNASWSHPLYGASNTNQPSAIRVLSLVKAYQA